MASSSAIATGALQLSVLPDSPEIPEQTLSPATTYSAFSTTPAAKLFAKRTVKETLFATSSNFRLEGTPFRISLTFEKDQLVKIDLFVSQPGDEKGWAGWTQQAEDARRAAGDWWIEQTFGKRPVLKPYHDDETGKDILPAEPEATHPKYLAFGWGEVTSYFDSKAGFSGVLIRYGAKG